MQNIKIDMVYLWVDGNDENWLNEKNKWAEKLNIKNNPHQNNPCRFIDNEELKYSLRSLEMNAPWINKIFIITNGQIPSWLDTSHPKIKIIRHDEIMPQKALPTFNSQSIVAAINEIKELSEHFLLGNDDTFFAKPVTPKDFFDKNGNPYIKLCYLSNPTILNTNDIYRQSIVYSINLLKEKYNIKEELRNFEPAHCIDAYRKSYFTECKNIFKKEYTETIHTKFRAPKTVQSILLKMWMLYEKKCPLQKNPPIHEQLFLNKVENLYISLQPIKLMREIIHNKSPKLLCINDCQSANDQSRRELKILLHELFPTIQKWEKENNIQSLLPKIKNSQTYVFSLKEDYCKYFSIALQSLIKNSNSEKNYNIIVLSSEISKEYKDIFLKNIPKNFSIYFFNMINFLQANFPDLVLTNTSIYTDITYYKNFIPLILKDYKKVLYTDTNVLFNDSLEELFDLDIDEKEILTIKSHSLNTTKHNQKTKEIILFNNTKINPQNYKQQLVELLKQKPQHSSELFNKIFENKNQIIPQDWCYDYGKLNNNKKLFIKNKSKAIYYEIANPLLNAFEEIFKDLYNEMTQLVTNQLATDYSQNINLFNEIYENKKIVLWGASLFLEHFIKEYKIKNNNILGIIDNNPKRQGEKIGKYFIYSPENLKDLNPDKIIITIINNQKERKEEIQNYLLINEYQNIETKII